ncbi:M15 family metallopeptidase [Mucilaginibacter sp. AW1-3]
MGVDLNLLVPGFKPKVEALLVNLKQQGLIFIPSEGLRDPFTQARYWRQSNKAAVVKAKIQELKDDGADFLAHCLESVGPQPDGDWLTSAIPGYSWHQWGEAVDCLWYVNKRVISGEGTVIDGKKGYELYATEAKKLGLEAGYFWTSHQDADHVQLRAAASPAGLYSLADINRIMKERFSQ